MDNEEIQGIVGVGLLAVVALGSAILFHARRRQLFSTSFISAVTATVLWGTAAVGIQGDSDPFIIIAIGIAFFWSFLAALGVGLVFRWRRGRAAKLAV
jgi:hypothetical protein